LFGQLVCISGGIYLPLTNPVIGPSFSVTFHSIDNYQKGKKGNVVISVQEKLLGNRFDDSQMLVVTGFYFRMEDLRYSQDNSSGFACMAFRRPRDDAGIVAVVLHPPEDWKCPGFLAIHTELVPYAGDWKEGFLVSPSTSRVRKNADGETIADSMILAYPKRLVSGRSIDYVAEKNK
jgi:hypothetical protein